MQKLDRLVWAASLSVVSYGLRIGIRVTQRAVLERLPERLPIGWRRARGHGVDRLYSLVVGLPRPNLRPFHLLYAGAQQIARSQNLDDVLETLELDLQFYLACRARDGLFVHAGVVSHDGRAIVIPGRSCTGKTSLVAALVRAGASYYSDEFAIIDPQGRVHPFPRPLSIRQLPDGRPKKVPVEALGGHPGADPLRPGLIVISRYYPGARWRPRRRSSGQGTLALLNNTVSARRRPQATLSRLSKAAASALVLQGVRGEATELAPVLLQLVGNASCPKSGAPAQPHRLQGVVG